MSKPFSVEIDCGGLRPVTFELTEGWLQKDPDLRIRTILGSKKGDERDRFFVAAREMMRRLIEDTKSPTFTVTHGASVWVIPKYAVRWIRIHDPQRPDRDGGGLIGFRREDKV